MTKNWTNDFHTIEQKYIKLIKLTSNADQEYERIKSPKTKNSGNYFAEFRERISGAWNEFKNSFVSLFFVVRLCLY